jgi:hypothetical protein
MGKDEAHTIGTAQVTVTELQSISHYTPRVHLSLCDHRELTFILMLGEMTAVRGQCSHPGSFNMKSM